jgi:hypothetical protein
VKERALRIGKPIPLAGVASEPENFDPDRPALLVLNSGVMHHVGTCRLSVKIARAAASNGILAVRFDFSGIGDSEPRRGALSFEESSIAEIREVMDYLQKTRGISRFVLYGLCSGADASYLTGLVDERVMGMIKIDGFCYRTWQYYVHYYAPLLLDGARWKSFLSGRLQRLLGKSTQLSASESSGIDEQYLEVPSYTRRFPPRDTVAEGLRKLMARDVKMFLIFTGGEPEYMYKRQYFDSFHDVDFRNALKVEHFPQANHIITQQDCQQQIVGGIADWVAAIGTQGAAGNAVV